ncbi:MAG: hypothetical protein H7A46_19520 [Verrucomicrobiales bacterium]|nr:hypothetical protein [Verrucomicrobiales bacterium]
MRSRFCARRQCPESEFEARFFRLALYRHAVPFAGILRLFWPGFFHLDTEFIGWIGQSKDMDDVWAEIDKLEFRNRTNRGWLRSGLRMRLNHDRVLNLAEEHLPEALAGEDPAVSGEQRHS